MSAAPSNQITRKRIATAVALAALAAVAVAVILATATRAPMVAIQVPGEAIPESNPRSEGLVRDEPSTIDTATDPASDSAPSNSRASASGGVLVARVVDRATGEPVPGVRVRVGDSDPRGWSQLSWREIDGSRAAAGEAPLTDAAGRCEIQVASGSALMVEAVNTEGDGQSEQIPLPPFDVGDLRELVIPMSVSDGWLVHVRVVDATDDRPIARARVSSVDLGFFGQIDAHDAVGDTRRTRITGAEGRTTIRANPFTASHISVRAEGFSPQFALAHAGYERSERALLFRMSRMATLKVTLAGNELELSGHPTISLSENWTSIRDLSGPLGQSIFTANVDEEGIAVLEGLPAGVLLRGRVQARGGSLRGIADPIVLQAGEVRDVTWTLEPGCTLEGILRDQDGRPVAGVRVLLTDDSFVDRTAKQARSDAEGRFTFEAVPAGNWTLEHWNRSMSMESREPERDVVAVRSMRISIEPGAKHKTIDVRADRGLTIHGRVLDPEDKPAVGAEVFTPDRDDPVAVRARTDRQGEFTLTPLAIGTYELTAIAPGFARSAAVTATPGERDVVLRLRASGSITGLVVGLDGRPRDRAQILMSDPADESASLLTPGAGFDGRFDFHDLAPGRYSLFASDQRDGIGVVDVEVVAGESKEKEIVLARGARVRVTSSGPRDEIRFEVRHDGRRFASSSAFVGVRREILVPPGRITVSSCSGDERFEKTISIAGGEVQDVTVP